MKILRKTLSIVGIVSILSLPMFASAATYHYLDLRGNVHSIEAINADQALTTVALLPNTLHSGVALDLGTIDEGDRYAINYQYTSTNGTLQNITAASADAARIIASDIVQGTLRAMSALIVKA